MCRGYGAGAGQGGVSVADTGALDVRPAHGSHR